MKRPSLNDAQELARRYPATFHAPSWSDLEAIGAGFWVQVCPQTARTTERLWAMVLVKSESALVGVIDQDCILTHRHGLHGGDLIEFERRHIYKILPPRTTT